MLIFYTLAALITLCRMVQFANVILIFWQTSLINDFWRKPFVYNFSYVVCMFLLVIMGFFQVEGMGELAIRMKCQRDQAEREIKLLNLLVFCINLSAFGLMVWLACAFELITKSETTEC